MRYPWFQIYRDAADEWRWHLRAGNGRIVADSAEGYATRAGAVRAVRAMHRHVELASAT